MKQIKDGYDRRSKITHGLSAEEGDQEKLNEIVTLTYNSLAHVVSLMREHSWDTQALLTAHLEDLKFS